jgi:hypothetical protein
MYMDDYITCVFKYIISINGLDIKVILNVYSEYIKIPM